MFVEYQRNDQTDFQVLLVLRYNEKDRILDRGYFCERIRERLWTGHPLGQYVRGREKKPNCLQSWKTFTSTNVPSCSRKPVVVGIPTLYEEAPCISNSASELEPMFSLLVCFFSHLFLLPYICLNKNFDLLDYPFKSKPIHSNMVSYRGAACIGDLGSQSMMVCWLTLSSQGAVWSSQTCGWHACSMVSTSGHARCIYFLVFENCSQFLWKKPMDL